VSRIVVGARFQTAGRMYFFEPGTVDDLAINEWVIVQTELGQDAARVQILPTDSPLVQVDPPLGTLVRKATATDKFELAKHKRREEESTRTATETAKRLGLDIHVLGTDWQFDGGNVVVFYSTEATGLDLAPFSVELAAGFGTRVELRRLGARDECDRDRPIQQPNLEPVAPRGGHVHGRRQIPPALYRARRRVARTGVGMQVE